MERRSVGMMVGGIILTSVGALVLSIGAIAAASNDRIACGPCAPGEVCTCGDESNETGPVVAVVGGLVAIGVGIPLIVIGARKVPAKPAAPEAALLVGPGNLSFRGRF